MKKICYASIIVLVFMFSACTVHIPYDRELDYDDIVVKLKVVPDNAEVLLDGKFVGEAYEFATYKSAIRL
ncbi:MAG: hypothetical protein GY765_27485, partial [bacterium]|nr:hypothetical protein [bacterium]